MTTTMRQDTLTPREKAAILMISLGKDYAAKLYKYLSDDEVEQLTFSITSMRRVDSEVRESVTNEFYEICMAQKFATEGGIEYARDVLHKAFGKEKADELIRNISSALRVRPFDFIRQADSAQVCNFLQNEHPQTIALVLSYLDPNQAAMVLASLPLETQTNVIARIANMGASAPEYVKEAESVLERKLSSLAFGNQTLMGGIDALVKILNYVDRGTERHLLESLEESDAELAEEIRSRMFVFEDIVKLSSQAIQRVLREIDTRDLTIALKHTTPDVAKVIYSNISRRLQEMIQEDIAAMGPVRVRDVEAAQQKIVNVIRRLDDAGEIIITRGGEEDSIIV